MSYLSVGRWVKSSEEYSNGKNRAKVRRKVLPAHKITKSTVIEKGQITTVYWCYSQVTGWYRYTIVNSIVCT